MTLIPFDDRDGFIWMDGKMLPWRDAKLHVLSHGLHYGGSVFEGERAYEGEVFKLREHSARLIKSAEYLDMKVPLTVEQVDEASREVLEANKVTEGYVRPIAWRGAEQLAISGQQTTIHVAFACWHWPKYFFPKGEDGGIALRTSNWRRPDPRTAPVQSKAAGIYMISTISKHEAERAGFDDVLMLDYKGRVAESSGANLFMVKDGELFTPDPECFLNGITRQTVLQLAKDMGVKVSVATIMPDELLKAEEIFVTGTAAEITPVSRIDETRFKVGKITKQFQEAYHALVRGQTTPQRATA